MPGDDKDKRSELAVSHKTSSDFINSGTFFDQRLVSAYFTSTLSTTMLHYKFTEGSQNNISINSGLLTNWKENKPYTIDSRERFLGSFIAAKTFDLSDEKKLHLKAYGLYASTGKIGAEGTYLAPEIKISNKDFSYGIGGIANKNTDNDQLYLLGEYKNTRLNLGAATPQYGEIQPSFRAMVSYDYKPDDKNTFQLFTSLQTDNKENKGAERFGITYVFKDDKHPEKVSLRTNFILNSSTANNIENANANVDIPFKLSKKDKHALSGIITVFGGLSGETASEKTPEPHLNMVYGLGVRSNLFDSKNYH